MGYLHLGAHLDFADQWAGESHLSTCAMARITELANLDAGNVVHVGARNSFNPKDHVELARERGVRFYPMLEVLERGVDEVMDETVAKVWQGTDGQYLSFNFNVMDSSCAARGHRHRAGWAGSARDHAGGGEDRRGGRPEGHRRLRALPDVRRQRLDLAHGGLRGAAHPRRRRPQERQDGWTISLRRPGWQHGGS